MSRGVVLWPDDQTTQAITEVWEQLTTRGLPSCATHTHRRHRPHVSLLVADELPVEKTLATVGAVPREPVKLLVESAGVFPGGLLFLACVTNDQLLLEQRRVLHTSRSSAWRRG